MGRKWVLDPKKYRDAIGQFFRGGGDYGFQGTNVQVASSFHESGLGMSKMSILRLSATFALQTACGDGSV